MSGDKMTNTVKMPLAVIKKSPKLTINRHELSRKSLVSSIKEKRLSLKSANNAIPINTITANCSSTLIPESCLEVTVNLLRQNLHIQSLGQFPNRGHLGLKRCKLFLH